MSEKGYEPPNYTQIPNTFLDNQMPVIQSLSELKVCLAVMRQTFGWHKEEDQLSISQLETLTGLSRPSVTDGVKAALAHQIITRRKEGNTFFYRLNVKDLDMPGGNGSKESLPKVVKNLNQQVVKNLNPQKKDRKKEKESTTVGGDEPPQEDKNLNNRGTRTPNQDLTDDLYRRIQDRHKVRLTKEQYNFHLGRFKEMLAKDNPTDEELDLVIERLVEKLPTTPKLDGVQALQDVRYGRHDGSAYEGPAPWEKAEHDKERDTEKLYPLYQHEPEPELTEEELEKNRRKTQELLERIGNA
jgi:phage replication O-like protein O